MSPHNPQFTATNSNHAARGMNFAYSSEKQMFWGKSDEDWLTKLSRYQFMCNQNKVTGADKISFLHYLLDGAALQFFINEIEGRISNWGDVIVVSTTCTHLHLNKITFLIACTRSIRHNSNWSGKLPKLRRCAKPSMKLTDSPRCPILKIAQTEQKCFTCSRPCWVKNGLVVYCRT